MTIASHNTANRRCLFYYETGYEIIVYKLKKINFN
jgi:hypothetical protein